MYVKESSNGYMGRFGERKGNEGRDDVIIVSKKFFLSWNLLT